MQAFPHRTANPTLGDVLEHLRTECGSLSFGRSRFPHLFQCGLPDAAIHAAGVTYLAALGLELGLPVISEYPITTHAMPQWGQLGRVFPDSVWFHPGTGLPWVLFEFERFETGDENKIRAKAENLALAWHQSQGTVELCVFIYWLRSSRAPRSIAGIQDVFEADCRRSGRMLPPPNARHTIIKAIACPVAGSSATEPSPASSQPSGGMEQLVVLHSLQPVVGIG